MGTRSENKRAGCPSSTTRLGDDSRFFGVDGREIADSDFVGREACGSYGLDRLEDAPSRPGDADFGCDSDERVVAGRLAGSGRCPGVRQLRVDHGAVGHLL